MSKYVLAIDEGTTGTTAVLLDRRLRVRASVNREFRQRFPRPGWVEHDLEDIWTGVGATVKAALRQAGARGRDVAAIGITNQRETTALWRRSDGRPVSRAIVWQDRRTTEACAALKAAGREPWVRERTGLVLDPYFSATKLRWLLDHVKGARGDAEAGRLAFGTIDTFLCLAAHRRRPRHRRLQRQPHAADGAGRPALGRRAAGALRRAARGAAGDPLVVGGLRHHPRARLPARRHPGLRPGRRPAGGALRPGLLRARRRQVHLRHRGLPAAERRRRAGPLLARPAGHGGLGGGR